MSNALLMLELRARKKLNSLLGNEDDK